MKDVLRHFAPNEKFADALLEHLATVPQDSAHDLSHILRVWQNARRISVIEGGDTRVLLAATLLHDCVNLPKDAPDRHLASRLSAEQAAEVLRALDESQGFTRKVIHAIEAHSFSAGIAPETLEAKILQDADRLDALGHIGIARCLSVSGRLDRAIYDPNDPKAERRALDDTRFALDHFQTKLLHLKDGFQTPTGQRLATARHAIIQSFFDGLLAEIAEA